MFIGRQKELEKLTAFYNDPSAAVACIYGRSGMGKTALVKAFIQDKPHLYFCAYQTTGGEETALLARVIDARKKLDSAENCRGQLVHLLEEIKNLAAESGDRGFVFVIDNYPAFSRADGEFDKILFDFITASAPEIKLILLSDSYLGTQKLIFNKKSCWYEVVSPVMELTAMGFYESLEFLKDVEDSSEKVLTYGITGGIPHNLKRVKPSFRESIGEIFFKDRESGLLPEKTMQTELRELSYYNHILKTLASGYNRVNQISASVDKPKDVVVPYMSSLINIGVVTKENPVTEKTNRKKTRYSIINFYDHFWFRFFAPYIDLFYEGERDKLIDRSVLPGKDDFSKNVLINVCKEYIEKQALMGKLPFMVREIGNWWQNDDEKMTTQGFDIVAIGDMDGEEAMVFGRVFFTDEPIGIATLKELIDLTKQVRGKKNVFYMVFSKSGFHENTTTVAATIKNIILVSLGDIVNG